METRLGISQPSETEGPEHNAPTEFLKFPRLPNELQLMVCIFALGSPRTFLLNRNSQSETDETQLVKDHTNVGLPALLQVCRLFRNEFLPWYTKMSEVAPWSPMSEDYFPDLSRVWFYPELVRRMTDISKNSMKRPLYANVSVDKLRIEDCAKDYFRGRPYNFQMEDIAKFRHFEFVVEPFGPRIPRGNWGSEGYYEANCNYLTWIMDDVAKRATDPVLSITIVISMSSQIARNCRRYSEWEEIEETNRIWNEINKSVKWEGTKVQNDIPADRMVHPFQNTKVLLKYEVEGKESKMEPVVGENRPDDFRRNLRLLLMNERERSMAMPPLAYAI